MIPDFIGPLMPFVPYVLLVSLRVGIALTLLPAPFSATSPMQVRVALSIMIGLAIAIPHPEYVDAIDPTSALVLGRAAVGEMLVGAVIGLTVKVALAAAEVAGAMAGFSMGLGFAMSIDPTSGEEAMPITRAMTALATLIFFALQGHHILIVGAAASLETAPPGDAFGSIAHAGVLRIGANLMAQGLRIAAPVVATLFILKLGVALMSKAAPRVHVFSLSFAIAVAGGMATMVIASPNLAAAIGAEIERLPTYLDEALGGRR